MLKISELNTMTGDNNADPDFESPYGCKFIVSVGADNSVNILKSPNIHYGFFDNGMTAEGIGIPYECDDAPGVYEWVCRPAFGRDWESGRDEFEGFDVISSVLLWSPSEEE